MAQARSNFAALFGRSLKMVIVALLLPVPIGVLRGVIGQLEAIQIGGFAATRWVQYGFLGYVGFHIILYRPAALFRAMHWIFSTLAVWLFGGQVSSTDEAAAAPAGDGKRKGKRPSRETAGGRIQQGSPLVAFSPYVVPMSVVLVCALGRTFLQFEAGSYRQLIDSSIAVCLGVATAFHWLMTADELQPQREQWHIETYLLAVVLIFLLTLIIGGAGIGWALPDYSHTHALSEGWDHAVAIYRAAFRSLFF